MSWVTRIGFFAILYTVLKPVRAYILWSNQPRQWTGVLSIPQNSVYGTN